MHSAQAHAHRAIVSPDHHIPCHHSPPPPVRIQRPIPPQPAPHIVAHWPPVDIGKESDRHWEEGDDLSLLDSKAIQYRRKGNAVADPEHLTRIAEVPMREFMRRGINQHTLEKICKREPVRAIKLTAC